MLTNAVSNTIPTIVIDAGAAIALRKFAPSSASSTPRFDWPNAYTNWAMKNMMTR